MKKILVINPNTSEEMTADVRATVNRIKRVDVEVETVHPAYGPESLESAYDTAIAGMMAVPAMAEELTPVTIYGVSDPQISAQQIIAKEKGFFEEQGLDVTNVLIESSGDLPSYIASGEAPVSCESTYTCTEMAAADVPMKMLTSTTDIGGTQGVVAGPDFEVTSAKDLEGCTMGMMNGSGVYIAVRNMAEQMGIDWTKINVVYLSPSEQIAALANGR